MAGLSTVSVYRRPVNNAGGTPDIQVLASLRVDIQPADDNPHERQQFGQMAGPAARLKTWWDIWPVLLPLPDVRVSDRLIDVASVAGTLTGQASLGTPGAQSGVTLTITTGTAIPVVGTLLSLNDTSPETVVLTAVSGSGPYTVAFTTTRAHATSGTIAVVSGDTETFNGVTMTALYIVRRVNAFEGVLHCERDASMASN